MGVTIESESFSADIGYGGFKNFRKKVATLSNPEFGKHYAELESAMFMFGDDKDAILKKYNLKTDELIENNIISEEIVNFCFQTDCGGSIDQIEAKQIYEKIKDYDDKILYGYVGRSDCAMFSDLKSIFKDCAENGGTIEWS